MISILRSTKIRKNVRKEAIVVLAFSKTISPYHSPKTSSNDATFLITFSLFTFTAGSASAKSTRSRRGGAGPEPVSGDVLRDEIPERRFHHGRRDGEITTGKEYKCTSSAFHRPAPSRTPHGLSRFTRVC